MRIAAFLAGLFACAAIFATSSSVANAETVTLLALNTTQKTSTVTTDSFEPATAILTSIKNEQQPPTPVPPPEVVHVVAVGDTLTSVATTYQITWNRIFNKNTQITQPDVIAVGDKLVIPRADEVLPDRAAPVPQPAASQPVATVQFASATVAPRGSSGGNTYAPGYCTWYVKNKRPDLPNNLGNADTWVVQAAAQGIPTGATPRVGAVGQRNMHVVYVEQVNADGTIVISEMNYQSLYTITQRTVPGNTFMYIY
ncbi:MAG TPA: CHAP domain-containing protein [Candidatus Saccharimonadales bacterium]|nr:CHAP domain-containing protein [Candidatus Saccharimonadales bacterium]